MKTMDAGAIERQCRECAVIFAIPPEEQTFLQDVGRQLGRPFVLPTRCLPCRRRRRSVPVVPGADVTVTCADCLAAFVFTERDRAFYAAHDLVAPRRCTRCRVIVRTAWTQRPDANR
jgi:hypothetical protein